MLATQRRRVHEAVVMKVLGATRARIAGIFAWEFAFLGLATAIAALGDSARGIAVVDQTVTDAELDRLTKAGMRGIRFHMLPGGALPWDILETMVARVGNFGWHVQLQLDGRLLPKREALLKKLTGTLVVDHVGKFLEPIPTDHAAFKVLPWLGQTVAGDRDAYVYLAESIRKFPDQARLVAMMEAAGLGRASYRNFTGGIAALHSGWRL